MKKTTLLIGFFFLFSNLAFANDALLKQAESGNPEAQFKVAAMFALGKLGNKTEEDKNKMFYWLEKSASQNYLKAQEILCKQYYERCEFEKSWKWTNIALKNGSNVAKSVMAGFLMNGYSGVVPIDKTRAIALARECPNEIISKCILCEIYTNGWLDVKPDLNKAMVLAEDLEKRNFYAVDIYKTMIKRQDPNINSSEYINLMINSFDKAIEKNKYSYELKAAYIYFLLDLLSYYNSLKSKIEKYLDDFVRAEIPLGLYCKYLYELKINQNKKIGEKYLYKAAEKYCPESYFDAFMAYLKMNGDDNINKAREIAEKALKCQDPDCLSKFIVFFNTIENNKELREVVGKAYIEGFNSLKTIKLAADNGDSKMMYLYSKLVDDKTEKEKYLIGAVNRKYQLACGDYAFSILKTNPEKAYKLAKSSINKFINDSPEILYIDGICALEGKVCEKNILYGLEQLGKSVDLGISNKAQVIKKIYETYSNIDEKEYLKEDDSLTNESLNFRKQMDIYNWGKKYMEFASDDEKRDFDEVSKNIDSKVINICEHKFNMINQVKKGKIINNQIILLQLREFGKVFENISSDVINTYVNNNLYKSLFELYGKKNQQKDENNIPDECSDNLRKITIAVEMYNMDHIKFMTTLNLNELKREKYLRGELNDTDSECSYSIVSSEGDVVIKCRKHGSLNF